MDSPDPEADGWSGPYVAWRTRTPAAQVELWRLWAKGRYPALEVGGSGAQRFSPSGSRNSADIARADLALRRVDHVVVFSDDSDFISLHILE